MRASPHEGRQGGTVAVIGVIDPVDVSRAGVVSTLQIGGHVCVRQDMPDAPAPTVDGIVVTVRGFTEWEHVRTIRAGHRTLPIVAIVHDPSPESYVLALRSGSTGAVPWEAPSEHVIAVLAAALNERTLLPSTIAWAIVAEGDEHVPLGPQEVRWLRRLAAGVTIQQLASECEYAERSMYRILSTIYAKLGAHNRSEAVVIASRQGLLDDRSGD